METEITIGEMMPFSITLSIQMKTHPTALMVQMGLLHLELVLVGLLQLLF